MSQQSNWNWFSGYFYVDLTDVPSFFEVINQLAVVCHIPALIDLNAIGIFFMLLCSSVYITIIPLLLLIFLNNFYCRSNSISIIEICNCEIEKFILSFFYWQPHFFMYRLSVPSFLAICHSMSLVSSILLIKSSVLEIFFIIHA